PPRRPEPEAAQHGPRPPRGASEIPNCWHHYCPLDACSRRRLSVANRSSSCSTPSSRRTLSRTWLDSGAGQRSIIVISVPCSNHWSPGSKYSARVRSGRGVLPPSGTLSLVDVGQPLQHFDVGHTSHHLSASTTNPTTIAAPQTMATASATEGKDRR